jgi:prepilin-type N-terminal cleavage/methylation domain-containing protein
MAQSRSRRFDNGFTLVEVLVATAILGLVFSVALSTIGDGIGRHRSAATASDRLLAARSLLDELVATVSSEESFVEGELDSGEPWSAHVSIENEEAVRGVDPPLLIRIELTLGAGEGGSLELVAYDLREPL